MKLSQLHYFMAICKHLNFSKAAKELKVAQATISLAVRELEKEFGITLIRRLTHGVVLTPEGQYFAERTKYLLEEVADITAAMSNMGNHRRIVRAGLPPAIGALWFPHIIQEFQKDFPDITIETVERDSSDLIQQLAEELVDIIIVPLNSTLSDEFVIQPIYQSEVVLWVSKEHSLAKELSVTIEQIKDERLVMFNNDQSISLIDHEFRCRGAKPNYIHYSNQFYTIHKYVAMNMAASFMLRDGISLFSDVVPIPLSPPANIDICIVTKKSRNIYTAPLSLVNFIQQKLGTLDLIHEL